MKPLARALPGRAAAVEHLRPSRGLPWRPCRRFCGQTKASAPANRKPGMKWAFAGGAVALMGGSVVIFNELLMNKKTKPSNVEHAGKPLIGGDWEMTDMNGNVITNKDFLGKYLLIYFGFTFCPDVCPRELTKLGKALEILENRGVADEVVPIMCTVDPRRDGPRQVAKYIGQFHPRLVGLTGSVSQVSKFVKTMRAYYSQPP